MPVSEIQEAIKHGVRKINIDTDIRLAMTGAVRKFMAENPDKFDARGGSNPRAKPPKAIASSATWSSAAKARQNRSGRYAGTNGTKNTPQARWPRSCADAVSARALYFFVFRPGLPCAPGFFNVVATSCG